MLPLTYVFEFNHGDDEMRRYILREFADSGAKHLVLGSYFFQKIMGSPAAAKTFEKEMESAGLSFMDSHAYYGPGGDLYLPAGPARRKMIALHQLCLEIAADFGVRTMAIHVGDRHEIVEGIPTDELHANIIQSLEELLPYAEQRGIVLCLENTYNICNTPERLIDAVEHFRSPYLGLCYDSGHANLMHPKFNNQNTASVDYYWYSHDRVQWDDRTLEKMLPYVVCCHLHDNNGLKDQHLLPGDGNIDWHHTMSLLHRAPLLQSFQCEAIPIREGIPIRRLCSGFSALIKQGQE